jgi:hypothetical protein
MFGSIQRAVWRAWLRVAAFLDLHALNYLTFSLRAAARCRTAVGIRMFRIVLCLRAPSFVFVFLSSLRLTLNKHAVFVCIVLRISGVGSWFRVVSTVPVYSIELVRYLCWLLSSHLLLCLGICFSLLHLSALGAMFMVVLNWNMHLVVLCLICCLLPFITPSVLAMAIAAWLCKTNNSACRAVDFFTGS